MVTGNKLKMLFPGDLLSGNGNVYVCPCTFTTTAMVYNFLFFPHNHYSYVLHGDLTDFLNVFLSTRTHKNSVGEQMIEAAVSIVDNIPSTY